MGCGWGGGVGGGSGRGRVSLHWGSAGRQGTRERSERAPRGGALWGEWWGGVLGFPEAPLGG